MSENALNNIPEKKSFWSPLADHECKPPDWLIEGWLPFDSFGVLYGAPSSGKSYCALDMSAIIASGRETWHEHKTKKKPMTVLYLCGEGKNGLRQRLEAWRLRGSNDLVFNHVRENLHISETSADLTDLEQVEMLFESIEKVDPKPALLVIDTLARNFGGEDENSTQAMNKFVNHCDLLRSKLGGMSVLVVHHTGLKEQERPRGSIALLAASDFTIFASNSADLVHLKSVRLKDGDPPKPLSLKFERKVVAHDEEGLSVPASCLVRDDHAKPEPTRLGHNQANALRYLKNLDQQSRDKGLNGQITLDEFTEAWRLNGENANNRKRTLEGLEQRGLILINDGVIRLRH